MSSIQRWKIQTLAKWFIDTKSRRVGDDYHDANEDLSASISTNTDSDSDDSLSTFNDDFDHDADENLKQNHVASDTDEINNFAVECSNSSSRHHSSDDMMRTDAISLGLRMVFTCKKSCPAGQRCHAYISNQMSKDLRKRLWNDHSIQEPPPSTKERRQRIVELFRDAYVTHSNDFSFSIFNEIIQSNVTVCEGSY